MYDASCRPLTTPGAHQRIGQPQELAAGIVPSGCLRYWLVLLRQACKHSKRAALGVMEALRQVQGGWRPKWFRRASRTASPVAAAWRPGDRAVLDGPARHAAAVCEIGAGTLQVVYPIQPIRRGCGRRIR